MNLINSPVVIGAIIALALFLGFWSGHVITFRTAYYFRIYKGKDDEQD